MDIPVTSACACGCDSVYAWYYVLKEGNIYVTSILYDANNNFVLQDWYYLVYTEQHEEKPTVSELRPDAPPFYPAGWEGTTSTPTTAFQSPRRSRGRNVFGRSRRFSRQNKPAGRRSDSRRVDVVEVEHWRLERRREQSCHGRS